MRTRVQLILCCLLPSLTSVEPQLGSISRSILQPAINVFNVLTGHDATNNEDQTRNSRQGQKASNDRSPNQLVNNQALIKDNQPSVSNYRRQNYFPEAIYRPGLYSFSCSQYFSYQQNEFGEKSGLVTVPNPNPRKNVLVLNLSLAARLPSVIFRLNTIVNHCD